MFDLTAGQVTGCLSRNFDPLQLEPEPYALRNKSSREAKKRDTSKDRSWLNRSTDSEDLLFNFSEDDEMDRINRRALLGTVLSKIYFW